MKAAPLTGQMNRQDVGETALILCNKLMMGANLTTDRKKKLDAQSKLAIKLDLFKHTCDGTPVAEPALIYICQPLDQHGAGQGQRSKKNSKR